MEANFGKCDFKSLEDNFNEAMKNTDFKNIVNSLDLPYEDIMKHTSKLELSVEEKNNCKGCKSLHECNNKVRGYIYSPNVSENRLTFKYVACSLEQERIKAEETSCNYYEMPDALRRARMKDIFGDDANRLPTVKWLKNFYDTFLENKHQKGLYLHGSFGSGKTYLICAMLNELSKKVADITIVYYPELLRSLKESFDKNKFQEDFDKVDFSDRMSRLKRCSILFIDDIGAESVTQWSRDEILGTILQYRMDASLPTFFTSNLTIEELEVHLSNTRNEVDKVKARRIIERIKQLTTDLELVSKNRRN